MPFIRHLFICVLFSLCASSVYALELGEILPEGPYEFNQDFGTLQLSIQNNKLQLISLNHDREVILPQFESATARIQKKRQKTKKEKPIFTQLKDTGTALESIREVRAPYFLFLNITLITPSGEKIFLPRTFITQDELNQYK